jgi:hypothetical protein
VRAREEAYSRAMGTAAKRLRASGHVRVTATADASLIGALMALQANELSSVGGGHDSFSSVLRFVDEGGGGVAGKMKILLHQLAPSMSLAAGCTRLMLARAAGDHVYWLSKPRGAKALVIARLCAHGGGVCGGDGDDDDGSDDDGCASVHARRHAPYDERSGQARLPGWPRAAGPFVLLEQRVGTLHVFDCSVHPLFVRLKAVDVAGIWTAGAENEALIAQWEAEARLLPDPS